MLLVALSYAVSVMGSFIALQTAQQIPRSPPADRLFWRANASFAMGGCGIWSMHFIGMLAFEMPMPMSYDVPITVLSGLIAVVVTGVGFTIVGHEAPRARSYIAAGTVMGLGISGMHYTRMAAMRMPAIVIYDSRVVLVSVFIGMAASTAALWLAANVERPLPRLYSAMVMGVAVCGMHYSGMAAASFQQTDEILPLASQALGPDTLAYLVFLCTLVILGVQIGTSVGRRAERLAEGAGYKGS